MKLRFTRPALRQLERVLGYIEQHNPQGARHVQERVQKVMHLLLQHPHTGQKLARPGGTRRIVVSPYPYVLHYRVGDGEIVIRGIRHTSRRPLA